ncbi:MAG: hypothetical protein JXR37_31545 [Kiritimatiellae bacterium]|nr:hypothetical protein [Kiritimatiellia bacterium]
MVHDNVELHNVEEVQAIEGVEGVRLQRVPEAVRLKLNPSAQQKMLSPACAEIRFVAGKTPARVTLVSPGDATHATVFHGMFQADSFTIRRENQTLQLSVPERLQKLDAAYYADMPFPPSVCRILLGGGPVHLVSVEGEGIRPPTAEECPRRRYLAYGTSITHGAAATAPYLCYAAQTARRLNADLINLGSGGSAWCEPELADYIAARPDWDFATLALSVNMIGAGFTLEQFHERVAYMVNTVAGSNTNRPVACITIFPHFRDFGKAFEDTVKTGRSEEFRQKLRDAVAGCPHPNVHLIEGTEILTEIGGLKPDLIHPADNGMIAMGEHLARRLARIV